MNYWFLYKLSDGSLFGAPYLGPATEWDNIPEGCGVIGPFPKTDAPVIVQEAFKDSASYKIINESLVAA